MNNNITKKEIYEQKRQKKIETEEKQKKEKKKNQLLFSLAVAIPLVILGGIMGYALYAGSGGDNVATPDIAELLPDQGTTHIKEGEAHPPYNSNPPTSGWHYGNPVDWGTYKEKFSQEQLVHNLEHGGIVIQYKPTLDPPIIKKLEELKASEFECKLVVAPNDALDKNIALTAWRRLYTSDTYDENSVKAFIKKYRNTGPELVPCR